MDTHDPIKNITNRQIDKILSVARAALEKASRDFPASATQAALEDKQLAVELFALIRTRIEQESGAISRVVKVNTERGIREALDATEYAQYVPLGAIGTVPKADAEEKEVHFFKVDGKLTGEEVEKQYEMRGLRPANPFSVLAINNPGFTDNFPNTTHWKDRHGKYVTLICHRSKDGQRHASIRWNDGLWGSGWWFAGVPKEVPCTPSDQA